MKLSRFVTGILAVALIAFMVSDVQAQRRGQGGGGRGGPGGGGAGGGGRGGPGGFGGGDPTMTLLRMEEVQEELKVSEKQKEAIDKMAERSRGERPDFSGVRDMSEEDRNKLFEKMRKDAEKRTAEMKDQLIEVLSLKQIGRLEEISLQQRGVQALSDPEVAGKLKITDAQKKELEEVRQSLQESMRERMRELFSGGGEGGGDPREAFGKIREEMEKEVLDVLDKPQREQFKEMKGEKFDMPQNAGRGFGGGRGGRGGGGDGEARGGRGGGGPGGEGRRGRGRPESQ